MVYRIKKWQMPAMALLVLLSYACSNNEIANENIENELATAPVRVSVAGWTEQEAAAFSRAAGNALTPISLLVVPEGIDDISKTITVEEGTDFNVSLRNGIYDLFAVCGLPADMPSKLSANIDIPEINGEKADFAVGSTSVTVENGVCTPSVISITAERQMAWLDLQITGVPENISKLTLYIKGLYDSYSLDQRWKKTDSASNRYSQITLTQDASSASTYSASQIMVPCSNATGVTFSAEATTTNGYTTLLTYTSSTTLKAGTRLTQTLEYGDLMIVEGGIGIGGWDDKTDDGTFSDGLTFASGDQYFSQAATVVNVSSDGKLLNILAHKPITATLNEMRTWDVKKVPYTLSPEINVQRWAMPTSDTSPSNVLSAIETIGWEAFASQFTANGLPPINRDALNIIAYKDKSTGKFFVYDFQQYKVRELLDETGTFLFHPIGIIQLAE